jgi:GT2 family glycosyltransferase
MKNTFVSIIMPNYNGEIFLEKSISSVLASSYQNFELLLIDDGSTDRSLEIIRNFKKGDSRISLFVNKVNIGTAAAKNMCINKARGSIVVFLDNDTEVTGDWLLNLIKPLADPDTGAAQSLIIDFLDRDIIQMAGGHLIKQVGWLAAFYLRDKYSKVKNRIKTREIIAISASLAVKREILEIVGGFDIKEAVHTEDLDLCWRIWLSGYRIILAPKSIMFHYSKSVAERTTMNTNNQKIYFHLAKNSFRSIIKNYQLVNVLKYLPVSVIINLLRGFIFVVLKGNFDALIGTIDALIWNFTNFSDTISQRIKVQSLRKNSDDYLFGKIMTRMSLPEIYRKYYA